MPTMPNLLQMPLRRMRAEGMTHFVLSIVRPFIDPDQTEAVYRKLIDAFYTGGVEVVSDVDRKTAGLSPRDDYGMTAEELIALEKRRFDLLAQPITSIYAGDLRRAQEDRAALEKYGAHLHGCEGRTRPFKACTCGFDAVMKQRVTA